MKKITAMILALSLVLCMFTAVSAAGTEIYVSPKGSDTAEGTKDAPVATLYKASQLVSGKSNATIYVMAGNYKVSRAAVFGKGTKNVTITSYGDGEVTFTGSGKIEASSFKKVTDTKILDRIIDKKAKGQVVAADLKAIGITDYGKINMNGFGMPKLSSDPMLLINGKSATIARYPDKDYLMTSEIIDPGEGWDSMEKFVTLEGKGSKFRVADSRLDKWQSAKDVWAFGYFKHDWAEASVSVKIDFEKKNIVETLYPPYGTAVEDRRVYFYNLLEEISMPGEWYLDRETGVLYLYPEKALTAKDTIEFVTFGDAIIDIDDAESITIKGLNFTKMLDTCIKADNSSKIVIDDCSFNDIGNNVIKMINTPESKVTYCDFKNLYAGAVYLDAGVRETLTSGNSEITNCYFENFQTVKVTQNPCIDLYGVGNTVAHNKFKDGKNIAIWFKGNNHIIEYNDVENVCTDTADTGAIYCGAHWEYRGNEIRYNYVHDIKKINTTTGMETQAIYLDDQVSGIHVHGNIIQNCPSVALAGGGRYNIFENNLFLENSDPFVYDERGLTWNQDTQHRNLEAMPYKSDVWAKTYPELVNILEDEPSVPKHNVVKNNVSYKTPDFEFADSMVKNSTIENNIEIKSTADFVDYKRGNLNLKEDAEIFEKLPDFKATDFSKIGIQKREEKTVDSVLKNAVALKINESKTFVFGKQSAVDANNSAVAPKIINNRTLVPVRFIAESFGGEVEWEAETKKVTVKYGESVIELYINKAELTLDGKKSTLDVPAQILEGRTMLPLRAVVEALGMNVFWDARGLIVISPNAVLTEADTSVVNGIIQKF